MPRLPQQQSQQVAPGQISAPLRPLSITSESFGASAFGAITDVATEEQRKRDRRASLRATMNAQKSLDDIWYGKDGGRWKEGEEFFDWAKGANQQVDDALKANMKGLSEPQSEMTSERQEVMRDSFDTQVRQRMGPVRKTYYEGAYAADMADLGETTVKHASDSSASIQTMQDGLDSGAIRIAEFMADFPEYVDVDPKIWAREQVEDFESDTLRRSISAALAAGNERLAKEYSEHFGHLLKADQKVAVDRDVKQANELSEIAATFGQVASAKPLIVSGDGPQLAEAAGREFLPPDAQVAEWGDDVRAHGAAEGWSQQQIERAVDYTRQRGHEQIRVEESKQTGVYLQLLAKLGSEGDLLSMQAQYPTHWNHITDDQRQLLTDRSREMAEGRLYQKDKETWPFVREHATGTPEMKERFIRFMQSGDADGLLEPKHLTESKKWLEDIVAGRRTKGIDTEEEIIKEAMRTVGLFRGNEKGGSDNGEQFWNTATDLFNSEKERRELDFLTKTEMDKLIGPLTSTAVFDSFGNAVEFDTDFFQQDTLLGLATPEDIDIDQINPDIITTGTDTIRRSVTPREFGGMTQDELELRIKKLYLQELFVNASDTSSAAGGVRGERIHRSAELIRSRDKEASSPLPFGGSKGRLQNPARAQRARTQANPIRAKRGL